MNYSQFLLLAERYYKPAEPGLSGLSAIKKNKLQSQRLRSAGKDTQAQELEGRSGKVKRGADNPHFDMTPHKDLQIHHSRFGKEAYTDIKHIPSGVRYTITHPDENRGHYSISWTKNLSKDASARETIKGAKDAWNLIEPRFPHGAVLHNTPSYNKGKPEKNTRAKMYQQYGFGKPNETNQQYGKVGRMPSSRQSKSVRRTKPYEKPSQEN